MLYTHSTQCFLVEASRLQRKDSAQASSALRTKPTEQLGDSSEKGMPVTQTGGRGGSPKFLDQEEWIRQCWWL